MNADKKILSQGKLERTIQKLKKKGKTIVFTNGCFDILHPGHVFYLKKARKYGDILVVGLNTDKSVRRLKGGARPINNQNDRAYLLAALETVDFISFFSPSTPLDLIKKVRPDILVKGGDWTTDKIAGGDFVQDYGGKVMRLPYLENYSTSKLIAKIEAAGK